MGSPWRINVLVIGISLLCWLEYTIAHSLNNHRITYVTKVDNAIINTPSRRIHSLTEFALTFTLHDGSQDVKFTLEPNNDIIPRGAVIEYLGDDGTVERKEQIVRNDYKVYKGNSWVRDGQGWTHAGWTRIVVQKDGDKPLFKGAFTLNGDTHHLLSRTDYLKTRRQHDPLVEKYGDEFMVAFRDSDTEPIHQELKRDLNDDILCQSDDLPYNTHPKHPINQMILEKQNNNNFGSLGLDNLFGAGRVGLSRRQDNSDIFGGGNSAGVNLASTIGSTNGCPKTRMVALIGVATDCTYTGDFSSEQDARTNIIQQINIVSDLYEKMFNITLGLSQLVISKANCPGTPPEGSKWNVPCGSTNTTIETRLNLFSEWRGQRADDGMALWTLLTTCETGSSVGLAWLGQLCQGEATQNSEDGSSVSGVNVVARTNTEWKVIAHEIGHTFGAVHDCTSTTCNGNAATASMCCPLSGSSCDAGGQFIMAPSTNEIMKDFSPCTVGNICSAIGRRSVDTRCLTSNKDVSVITEQECGNGIVEDGEDCDCGGEDGCNGNQCCNPTTCKFQDNAVCDDSNEDCCRGCQFASSETVCRASNGECDPEEKCTGSSSSCPADVISKDGDGCGNGLKCASGQCTSRDRQCQSVMGRFSSNNDTRSCDNSNCVLTCQSPEFGADTCLRMQQYFLDGTPCRGDGVCRNGQCSGASPFGEVKSWIEKNMTVVIAVSVSVGTVILILIASCCISRCCRRRRRPKIPLAAANRQQSWQRQRNNNPRSPPAAFHHPNRGSEGAANQYYHQPSVRYA